MLDKSLFLSAKDLIEMGFGSKTTVYRLMNSPGFPAIKIGGRVFVTKKAFNLWLKKQLKQHDPGAGECIV